MELKKRIKYSLLLCRNEFIVLFILGSLLFVLQFALVYREDKRREEVKAEIIQKCKLIKVNLKEETSIYQCDKLEYVISGLPENIK